MLRLLYNYVKYLQINALHSEWLCVRVCSLVGCYVEVSRGIHVVWHFNLVPISS